MKNSWFLVIGVVIIVVVIAGIYYGNSQKSDTIKIGAIYPLTGGQAYMGVEYQRGLEMAAEQINSNGGINNKKIELIFEDNTGDAQKSIDSANKLINIDQVRFLFTAFSPSAQALAPIAKEKNIIFFYSSTINIGDGKNVFKDYWDIGRQSKMQAEAVKQEKIKKLGILKMIHPSTSAFDDNFKKGLDNYSLDVMEEKFNIGDKDFRTQLTKIKEFGPEAILIHVAPGNEAEEIIKELIELKMTDIRLFSSATAYRNGKITLTYSSTLKDMGAIDSSYGPDLSIEKSVSFKEKYESKYQIKLIGDAIYAYDDLYILKNAMELAGDDKNIESISKEILQINYSGVAGNISFDSKGNSIRPSLLQKYSENGWVDYAIVSS